ncbi:hypothetical protein R21Y_47 [Vibrio phage vB_VhaS_R21Y]|nr:hypothetical protein vBVcaS_HC055 [Vibrio phage vB_VcaS_HC]WKV32808.1 hypothetical protein R21Y_47 [Vibrio phage vB_VhaS_R21Y]
MKTQQKRKEIESSLQGLIVKRFNHYLYRQCVITKRVVAKLRTSEVDSHHLTQRLTISARSLDQATSAEKSNEWASHGLEKVKLSNELIESASGISAELRSDYADSLANVVKYSLNHAMLYEGFGELGKVCKRSNEQQAINNMLASSHYLNNLDDSYKPVVSLIMDRAKLLNWLAQSQHVSNFAFLWSIAIRSAVLTLALFLESPQGRKCPNAMIINEQLLELMEHERKLEG